MNNVYELLRILQERFPAESLAQQPRVCLPPMGKKLLVLWLFHNGEWLEFGLPTMDWLRSPRDVADEITKLAQAETA